MPELPEVETVKRTIEKKIVGKVIKYVDVKLARLIKWPAYDVFAARLSGKKILNIRRRGKYLLIDIEGDLVLVIHLRMTGRLKCQNRDEMLEKHSHILFYLEDDTVFIYSDTRTLGTLYLMHNDELWRISGLSTMGPEPLSDEFTASYLENILGKRKGNIKAALLDQKLIGGLGNIYVDECLFLANVLPTRKSDTLTHVEIMKLHEAINRVITDGILHGGTSFRDYVDGEGMKGSHQNYLSVYGRTGKKCTKCNELILKTEIAGRGTHYCSSCQK